MSKKMVLAFLLAAGCGEARILTDEKPIIVAPLYVDEAGKPIGAATPATAQVMKVAGTTSAPVLAPDGHAITWGEFSTAKGTVQLSCEGTGTRVQVRFERLIPNGVYSGWLVFFQSPGFLKEGFGSMTGLAPLGPLDGSRATVTADATGAAALDVVVPAGNVTVPIAGRTQAIPSCLLDAYEVHVVGAYHIDGHTCGDNPCAPDKVAEQVGWMIFQGQVQSL